MSPTSLTIGLVEDSDEDFTAFARVVSRDAPHAEITRWRRAEDLLERLETDATWPSILVVDLNLPGIDGAELVRRLRTGPATRGLPALILSGSGRQIDVDRCYAAGANAYLTKPSNPTELGALLQMVLTSVSFMRAPTAQGTAAVGDAAVAVPSLDAPREAYERQLLEERDAARRAAGRAELLQRITSRLANAMSAAQLEEVLVSALSDPPVRAAQILRTEGLAPRTAAAFEPGPDGSGTVGSLPLLATSGAVLGTLRVEIEGTIDDEQEALLHQIAGLTRAALERLGRLTRMVRQGSAATDLPVARWWSEAVGHALDRGRKDGEHVTAVVVELRGFDRYTTDHGHVSADRLLIAVSDAWRRAGVDLMSRNGGEDFAGLVVGKGERQVTELVSAIRKQPAVSKVFSVGIAQWNRSEDGARLLARAEENLAQSRGAAAGR